MVVRKVGLITICLLVIMLSSCGDAKITDTDYFANLNNIDGCILSYGQKEVTADETLVGKLTNIPERKIKKATPKKPSGDTGQQPVIMKCLNGEEVLYRFQFYKPRDIGGKLFVWVYKGDAGEYYKITDKAFLNELEKWCEEI